MQKDTNTPLIACRLGLAGSNAGNVLAAAVVLATVDLDVGPGPVGAAGLATDNGNVGALGVNSTGAGDVLEGEASDGETAGGVTVEVTAIVVLLNQDTVLGDLGQGDVRVGDALDLAASVLHGLDTDTVGGLGNLAVQELDGVNDVVGSAANAANGQTVATRAETTAEGDVLYLVNIFHCYRRPIINSPCRS